MPRKRVLHAAVVTTAIAAAALTANPGAAAEDKDQQPDPAQIARGAQAWAETCNRCHNLRSPDELSDEDWDVSVTHMRVRANLPGQLARDIKAFLKSSN